MRLLGGAATVVLMVVGALPASADDPARFPDVEPGRFVVADAAVSDVLAAMSASGPAPSGTSPVVVSGSRTADAFREADRLSQELGAEVVPMVRYRLVGDPTAEPSFREQWALENTGQSGGTPGADIDMRLAWSWTMGEGAVVAVVDSGLDPDSPEVAGQVWVNAGETPGNGIDDDGNGFVDDTGGWDFLDGDADTADDAGHGTAVAGVVAGAVNDAGIAGVAPAATLMVVRACNAGGCPADAVAAAVVYAANEGADVINLSLGARGRDPLVEAAVRHAESAGAIVVAAAGNAGVDVDAAVPWTPVGIDSPALVGVAWSDQDDRLALQSNFGSTSVDLAAPGSDILAPTLGAYAFHDGSSFAAPHVAGVAALMRSIDPSITAWEMLGLLVDSADPISELSAVTTGGGRLNAAQAVYGAAFHDIPRTTFAAEVMWVARAGIAKGCDPPDNHRFCPTEAVTRGQMAAFLVRALGLPAVDAGFDPFSDDDGSVFEDDIARLAQAGITKGCAPSRYCPSEPVTRGQMAAFLVRAFGFPLAPGDYDPFSDDDGSVFEEDIARLAQAGVTRGCTATGFCSTDDVTRGQMAAFLVRSAAQPATTS